MSVYIWGPAQERLISEFRARVGAAQPAPSEKAPYYIVVTEDDGIAAVLRVEDQLDNQTAQGPRLDLTEIVSAPRYANGQSAGELADGLARLVSDTYQSNRGPIQINFGINSNFPREQFAKQLEHATRSAAYRFIYSPKI